MKSPTSAGSTPAPRNHPHIFTEDSMTKLPTKLTKADYGALAVIVGFCFIVGMTIGVALEAHFGNVCP